MPVSHHSNDKRHSPGRACAWVHAHTHVCVFACPFPFLFFHQKWKVSGEMRQERNSSPRSPPMQDKMRPSMSSHCKSSLIFIFEFSILFFFRERERERGSRVFTVIHPNPPGSEARCVSHLLKEGASTWPFAPPVGLQDTWAGETFETIVFDSLQGLLQQKQNPTQLR